MVYHFVKHIGFDIEADSLEQARVVMAEIDDCNGIEDTAYDAIFDAIRNTYDLDTTSEEFDAFYDNCDAHAGNSEYVGYTDDEGNDPEERLYDYLTDADEDDDEDVAYRLTDKGRDWLDFVEGKYPQFDENDYDSHGNRLLPRRDGSIEDQLARVIVSALLGL